MVQDHNQAEAIPFQEPESTIPELHLVEGGGENPAGPDDERPELHVVTDSDDLIAEGQAEATEETDVSPERHLKIAKEAGQRAVGLAGRVGKAVSAVVETFVDYGDEHHKKGGGGWYLRQLIEKALKMLEAKTHPSDCQCELHDDH